MLASKCEKNFLGYFRKAILTPGFGVFLYNTNSEAGDFFAFTITLIKRLSTIFSTIHVYIEKHT